MDVASALGWIMTPAGRRDPYPAYRALHQHGPVVRTGADSFVVVGYAAVDQLLRDPRMSVRDEAKLARNWPDWRANTAATTFAAAVPFNDPPDHTRVRQPIAAAFTARRMASIAEAVAEQVDALCDELARRCADGRVADLVDDFALPLPVGVMCALLGVPAADHGWFRERVGHLTAILELQPAAAEAERAHRVAGEVRAYLADLVEARRRAPADDLTTALVRAHDAGTGTLTAAELLANLVVLLAAALDSTTYLLGNGLVTLLGHPAQAARLRADDTYAAGYVEELLRFDAPAQLTVRRTLAPTEVAGIGIPASAEVLLLLGAANRDPHRFADPDTFDPERPANQPLSFGAGLHFCLGAALARLEARVALPAVLRRLPDLTPAGEPVRSDRFTVRGYASLPVTLAAAAPSRR